jgi:hypothetical protein
MADLQSIAVCANSFNRHLFASLGNNVVSEWQARKPGLPAQIPCSSCESRGLGGLFRGCDAMGGEIGGETKAKAPPPVPGMGTMNCHLWRGEHTVN